ncbi:ribonuclease H-like YkuK family protein [Bacillus taeanensis]|uniref:DUF458 domain-containing protein n=1 Tax=Bacillus taeanensis TaxID=273032 RepID=A0A366Y592_9BACI|nr:ribonuclease H-like YkuK family protein [Bacillus taeanensis]RBW71381.1 hypothetical protein DS031_01130 [Bacillus taeanensis]
MYFLNPSYGKVSLDDINEHIKAYLKEDPKATYKVVIGTDSKTTQKCSIIVTAFIIHRVGKGARFYYQKVKSKPLIDLRYRIYKETELSLTVMDQLKQHGITDLLADWPIEIHLDVGQQGETRKLIQEVVGWVTSVGYVAKIKPNAYGASAVADKYTR